MGGGRDSQEVELGGGRDAARGLGEVREHGKLLKCKGAGEDKVLKGREEDGEELLNGSREGEKLNKPVFPLVIWSDGLEAPPLATFISPCPGLCSISWG